MSNHSPFCFSELVRHKDTKALSRKLRHYKFLELDTFCANPCNL
jgi:hypothetical protein